MSNVNNRPLRSNAGGSSLASLRLTVDKTHEVLTYLVQTPLEELPSGAPGVLNHVNRLKRTKVDYAKASQNLSASLIKNACIDNAKDVRNDRHELLNEVNEYIKLANVYLRDNDYDSVSNIDVYSTASQYGDETPSALVMGEEIDLSRKLEDVHIGSSLVPALQGSFPELLKTQAPVSTSPTTGIGPGATCLGFSDQISPTLDDADHSIDKFPSFTPVQKEFQPGIVHTGSKPDSVLSPNLLPKLNTSVGRNLAPGVGYSVKTMYDPCQPNVVSQWDGANLGKITTAAPIAFHDPMPSMSLGVNMYPYRSFANLDNRTVNWVEQSCPVFQNSMQNTGGMPSAAPFLNQPNVLPSSCPVLSNSYVNASQNFYVPPPISASHIFGVGDTVNPPRTDNNNALLNYLATKDLTKDVITKFDGTAYKFWSWTDQIKSKVSNLNLSPTEIVNILQSNSAGSPNKMIQDYAAASGTIDSMVLQEIWNALLERYGSPTKISQEIKAMFRAFKVIKPPDLGRQVQELHDLCKIASFNMQRSPELQFLNISDGLKEIRSKLPKYLQDRWRTYGQKYEDANQGIHPPFVIFISFLNRVARELTNKHYEENSSDVRTHKVLSTKTSTCPTNSNPQQCPIHKSTTHLLPSCKAFLRLPLFEKKKKLLEYKLCFKCMAGKHLVANCNVEVFCEKCNGSHHTALHYTPRGPSMDMSNEPRYSVLSRGSNHNSGRNNYERNSSSSPGVSLCTKVCAPNDMLSVNCSKTVLVFLSHIDNPSVLMKVYAILDEHSNCTLIDPKVISTLNVKSVAHDYVVSTVGGCETVTSGRLVRDLRVRGVHSADWIDLPDCLSNDSIPDTAGEVATRSLVKSHKGIACFSDQFAEFDADAGVMILIGRDCGQAMGTICRTSQEPWVHETPLGWALVGNTCVDVKNGTNDPKRVLKTIITHEHLEVRKIFPKNTQADFPVFKEMEDDEQFGRSVYDEMFLGKMRNGIHRKENRKLEAPLPFCNSEPLPCNQAAVFHRTKNTLGRLKSKPGQLDDCIKSMQKNLDAGYIEEISDSELDAPKGRCWWLPVVLVYHARKNKVRVVFDASAKYNGISLNSCLLTGPDINNDLRGVLLRFRENKVGVIADIENMFCNFSVNPSDRDFLRFFWYKNNDASREIVQYRANYHVFGCSSSPSVAIFCMRYTAELPAAESLELGKKFINKSFYVDDGIASFVNADQAIQTVAEAKTILDNCGVRLHKILSNSVKVMQAFPPSERAEGYHSLDYVEPHVHRTLGVIWDPYKDVFRIQCTNVDKPFTKRCILSVIGSIYDPIGVCSPVTLAGRLIQRLVLPVKTKLTQELSSCDWDDILPDQYLELWSNWKASLLELNTLELPRCMIVKRFVSPTRELHVFSDASEEAIGFVIYMRCIENDEVSVSFVTGGSKVAPKGATSIPRLELCAAVEAVQTASRVSHDLDQQPDRVLYYTDSMIVLGYVTNLEKRFTKYVTRRVGVLHKLSAPKDWHYVSTDVNPSDIASRSCKPHDLANSNWLTGPEFLWDLEFTPNQNFSDKELPEQVTCVKAFKTEAYEPSFIFALGNNVSSWLKIIKTVKVVMKMRYHLDILRQKNGIHLAPRAKDVSYSEALLMILRLSQGDCYGDISKKLLSSKKLEENHELNDLSPFVDKYGIVRVGGRLKNASMPFDCKHPALLSPVHPVTKILVQYFHEKVGHQGRHLTHGEVRYHGYHIFKGKSYIRRFLQQCVLCKKLRGATLTQIMADLPVDRLEEVPPFCNTGLDVFGPYMVQEKRATRATAGKRKVWVIIYVCLVSRAVHVDILPSLDTSSFRNALQRFISVRGTPKLIRSDNGTNFVAAYSQMSDINLDDIQNYLSNQCIEWLFNPPYASHFGGVYERKIGAIKRVMEGCLALMGPRIMSFDEFLTLLQEAGAIVNNTPLCGVSDDPADPMPITPAALLTLRESPNPPPLQEFGADAALSYGKLRWRRVQYLAHEFWLRWRKSFILDQQRRHKWKTRQTCVNSGDVVLVKTKNAKRNEWPMARVRSVKLDLDGLVRVVTLQLPPLKGSTKLRTQIRSIHDLVLLVPSRDHNPLCFNTDSLV